MFPWNRKSERIKMAETLVGEFCEKLGLPPKRLGRSARDVVARKNWTECPEVEMRHFIYYAAASAADVIEAHHFRPVFTVAHEAISGASFEDMALSEIVGQKIGHFFRRMEKVEPRGVYDAVMRQVEKPLIGIAMEWAEGSQVKAARALGMSRNTLRRKLKEMKIK